MPIKTIAFLSNTITHPFNRYLKDFKITHYPLDTILHQLYLGVDEDILVILLGPGFFNTDHNEFSLLKAALIEFRHKNNTKIIINTISDSFNEIYLPYTFEKEIKLLNINEKIVSLQKELIDICILDFYSLTKEYGLKNLITKKNGYLFQIPFSKIAIELLANKIKELVTLFSTVRIKAIAVDADNTLWGGIVGESGIEGIQIDQNYPGIVYIKFQDYLKELQESGIILILLSKNDEDLIKQVFTKKVMPLNLNDFVAYSVNWNPKSENLSLLLNELKLTTSNVIFLDDSDIEISEMQARLGISSYKMNPIDPILNLEVLQNITGLKTLYLSQEDTLKTRLYQDEKNRLNFSSTLTSRDDFIASLQIEISVTCNNTNHLERITQLIHKTNQFNVTTKRYDLSIVQELMFIGDVYDFSVKDKFGDMGIVGVIIIINNIIDTFLMSCRVLGRGIEENILNHISSKHRDLTASYVPTAKNSLVESFFEKNGFKLTHTDSNRCKYYHFEKKVDINKHIKVTDDS